MRRFPSLQTLRAELTLCAISRHSSSRASSARSRRPRRSRWSLASLGSCGGSASIPDKVAAVLPEDVNAMRTFDVVPVIRLQSNQHRIELPIVIKRLFSQRNSLSKLELAKNAKSTLIRLIARGEATTLRIATDTLSVSVPTPAASCSELDPLSLALLFGQLCRDRSNGEILQADAGTVEQRDLVI